MKSVLIIVSLCFGLSLAQPTNLPTSCAESGKHGVQLISIPNSGYAPFYVFCDAETLKGNWTVIQRRINGTENFYRPWLDYKYGFGNASAEYWLGLGRLQLMASYEAQELIVVLEDFNNKTKYTHYDEFEIGNETQLYKLNSLGLQSGNAGDSLRYHLGKNFTTYDRDTASYWSRSHKSGWWATEWPYSNLNGLYLKGKYSARYPYGTYWTGLGLTEWYSLKSVKMMIRPRTYLRSFSIFN